MTRDLQNVLLVALMCALNV